MSRLTLKAINREIERLGGAERLVRGCGYFYFIEGETGSWGRSSVYVYRLHALTLDQWVKEWREMAGQK